MMEEKYDGKVKRNKGKTKYDAKRKDDNEGNIFEILGNM